MKIKNKFVVRKLPLVLALLFFLLSLAFSFIYYGPAPKELPAISQEPIRLIRSFWPGVMTSNIALEKGFFEENGVVVELDIIHEYPDMIKEFEEGGYDGFFGVYTEALSLDSKDSPLTVVYIADFSDGADIIYSRDDIKNVQDLKGKTISIYSFDDFSYLFVLALLEKFGLEEEEVNLVTLPSAAVIDAIKDGTIDAGIAYTETEEAGEEIRVLITSVDTPKILTDVLVLKSDVVQNRPRAVQALVDSLFMGLDFILNNKEEAYEIESNSTGLSIESVDGIVKWLLLPNREENQRAFKDLEHGRDVTSLTKSGKFIESFLIEKGIIDEKVNLDALLDSQFVEDQSTSRAHALIIIVFAVLFGYVGLLVGKFINKMRRKDI